MEKSDLTTTQLFFLRNCRDNPNFQYVGVPRTELNTLCSFGLVSSLGNLRYEITKRGEEILDEDDRFGEDVSEKVYASLVGEQ